MRQSRILIGLGLGVALTLQSGCMGFGNKSGRVVETPSNEEIIAEIHEQKGKYRSNRGTIWDLFKARKDQGELGAVNKYIWNASLEVLDFLPVQSVDPFTGVIITGFGTPPGGGTAYRATIYISDPALEARSLNVAISTRSGSVSASTLHAIEDAILTRARQLRARDSRL